jgi:carbon monoxide dehydrogenase subunit G
MSPNHTQGFSQAGSALVISIVFLLLLATLALTGLRASTTNAQITGKAASMGEGVVVGVLDALIKDFSDKLAAL